MMSRRGAKVLVALGAILLLAGLGAVGYASIPGTDQETFPIIAGAGNFSVFTWSVLAGGTIAGSFTVANGTPVTVFVYDQAEYASYQSGSNLSGLYTVTAASASFSVALPGYGTYYLVFQHGSGYESVEQDVSVDLTATGLDPTTFLGGVAAAVLGVALLAIGVRRLRVREPSAVAPVYGGPWTPPPPLPGSGPDTSASGAGLYRIPPPLPGSASGPIGGASTGTIRLAVENRSAVDETVQVLVDGAPATAMTVPAGTSQTATVRAALASAVGSTVRLEVVTSSGRRAVQDVFVGEGGVADVALRVG